MTLKLTFQLYESKAPIVNNTAIATLRQMLISLFEFGKDLKKGLF
jgi:hypothetical protein